ncbi:hypothetical protein ABL78_3797 [Leptomonas seymouri]|uniref:Uncharacterized protein n=1 Tax=Leptomonas seymouri TaxID=5684 RepID=A0A0N1I5N7_LEPSE|nr:hypothetical protein ABL78_3797 [Leptomonas seymouri]|eukprot:KPI87144.1 hypothetical protein ABL78_3797 [Leptomonas seymouri]
MMEFPFQWDDGQFISPFIASSEEDMEMLAGWLVAPYLTANTTPNSTATARRLEMRLTDLGCGDATALLSLAEYVQKGWQELGTTVENSSQRSLHLLITGVELDDALLVKAEESAASFAMRVASPTSSPVSAETHFVSVDIRVVDLDVYFPRRMPCPSLLVSTPASPLPPSPPYVLYVYLLPEALETLREKLVEVLCRGWMVASNRWTIPGLDHLLKERVGHIHIYYQ